jgi:hypothetical protein
MRRSCQFCLPCRHAFIYPTILSALASIEFSNVGLRSSVIGCHSFHSALNYIASFCLSSIILVRRTSFVFCWSSSSLQPCRLIANQPGGAWTDTFCRSLISTIFGKSIIGKWLTLRDLSFCKTLRSVCQPCCNAKPCRNISNSTSVPDTYVCSCGCDGPKF